MKGFSSIGRWMPKALRRRMILAPTPWARQPRTVSTATAPRIAGACLSCQSPGGVARGLVLGVLCCPDAAVSPVAIAVEPLDQTCPLTGRFDRLRRHPEDGRTRIAVELLDIVQGGHSPAGDEHHLAHAGLVGCAPLNEQTAAAVVPASDVGPDEDCGL